MQRVLRAGVGEKKRPVCRDSKRDRNGAGALHGNGVLLYAHGRARLLAVKILHVELQIGGAPGNAIVVADDHRGQSDDGRAGHIQAGRLQVHQVPGRGNGELQMRVIREDRLAAGGARSGHGPGIRTRLRVVSGADWKQEIDLAALAGLEHLFLEQLAPPTIGQGAIHLETGQQAIAGGPGTRIVAQQRELQRQSVAMGVDEVIHAARKGCQDGSLLGHEGSFLRLCDAAQVHAAGFAIRLERGLAYDLRQFSGRAAAQSVHLPQPILGHRVALQENRVFPRSGLNVRDALGIARDAGLR